MKQSLKNRARLGVHTSIAGGMSRSVERAAALSCQTMQIFSHNPRQWKQVEIPVEEVRLFVSLRQKYDINPVFIHASYLINLASCSSDILRNSIKLLSYELKIADQLGAEYVVVHTGSARGNDKNKALRSAIRSVIIAASDKNYNASVLLENTAGERGDLTSSIQTMAEIIDVCHSENIAGVCIDTCHAFSSGYDISLPEGVDRLISEINKYIGFDKLKLIHLNDSKRPSGSGVDRHEHIGKGFIGISGFRNFLSDMRISGVPLILETPKTNEDDDRKNLNVVRKILNNYRS